jgi:hypothetical protein
MRKTVRMVWLAGAVLGLSFIPARADELDAVQKKICEAWAKHKSITAKITLEQRFELGGMVLQTKGDGIFECMRKGDKTLSRTELKLTTTQKFGDEEKKMDQEMLSIVDEQYSYTLSSSDFEGQKRTIAVKGEIDPQMNPDPQVMFKRVAQDHDLKLMPEEAIDGKKVFVIAATPKEKMESPAAPAKNLFYFLQEAGVLTKVVGVGQDDKPLQTMTYSDFKFDVDLKPERFEFKAPEGVEVIDQTKKP